jgi:hypothetical protein
MFKLEITIRTDHLGELAPEFELVIGRSYSKSVQESRTEDSDGCIWVDNQVKYIQFIPNEYNCQQVLLDVYHFFHSRKIADVSFHYSIHHVTSETIHVHSDNLQLPHPIVGKVGQAICL